MTGIDSLIEDFYTKINIITAVQIQPYNIKLTTPWISASSHLIYRQGLLIKITINNTFSAIGECAPMPEAGTETLAQSENFFYHQLQK